MIPDVEDRTFYFAADLGPAVRSGFGESHSGVNDREGVWAASTAAARVGTRGCHDPTRQAAVSAPAPRWVVASMSDEAALDPLVPRGTVLELSASHWRYGDGEPTLRVERERPDLSRWL